MNCECCGRNTFALGSLGPYCFECALTTIFEHRDRGRRNMSEIKVGDRVRGAFTGRSGTVIAITEQRAWIRNSGEPFTIPLCNLTHIEPEPVTVTLTPKYKVGQEVMGIGSGSRYILGEYAIAYYVGHGEGWMPERAIKPVPTPCPTCKGSGKASE